VVKDYASQSPTERQADTLTDATENSARELVTCWNVFEDFLVTSGTNLSKMAIPQWREFVSLICCLTFTCGYF